MIKFNKNRVLFLYQKMMESTGGTYGIRDESILDSALESPYQTFDNQELFPSVIEKASRLCF